MIVTETLEINGRQFTRTYSDRGMQIYGGEPEGYYSEACEPSELGRTYTETDIPIESDSDAEEILDILLGGESE